MISDFDSGSPGSIPGVASAFARRTGVIILPRGIRALRKPLRLQRLQREVWQLLHFIGVYLVTYFTTRDAFQKKTGEKKKCSLKS